MPDFLLPKKVKKIEVQSQENERSVYFRNWRYLAFK